MATEDDPLLDEQEEEQDEQEKVQLDDEVAQDMDTRAMEKVELDLDDAPFLEDEEDEEPESDEDEAEPEEGEEKTAATSGDGIPKWRVFAGAGLALLLTAVIVVQLVGRTGEPEQHPPTARQNATNQTLPSDTVQTEQPVTIVFEPFTVEYLQEGSFRFLNVSYSVVASTKVFGWEVERKKRVLRDAVYHYLMNKDLMFLADSTNAETLKTDLLKVMNQYLNNGQLRDLFFETYMVM